MTTKLLIFSSTIFYCFSAAAGPAQELGPHFNKVKDGIYTYAAVLNEANATII